MKNYAVICEYNPFHFGHEYQISKIKEQGGTVTAIMSGSFCQRGEASVIDKYARAQAAVEGGADLVLELPFPYSAAGAEKFAFAGVNIIGRLGFADAISFGSECGDAKLIAQTAKNTLSSEFLNALSENLKNNREKPYGAVYFETYDSLFGGEGVFGGSNNILGVAYASEIIKNNLPIELTTIKRNGEEYNGGGGGFSSASTIRKAVQEKEMDSAHNMLPEYSFSILQKEYEKGSIYDPEKLFPVLASFLRMHSAEQIAKYAENDISLAARLIRAGGEAISLKELYELACTKKYSPSHVRRALLFSYFGVTDDMLCQNPAYTVLLAANKKGRELLAKAKKISDIPIITKPADYEKYGEEVKSAFELSLRAESIRALALKYPENTGNIIRKGPWIEK